MQELIKALQDLKENHSQQVRQMIDEGSREDTVSFFREGLNVKAGTEQDDVLQDFIFSQIL